MAVESPVDAYVGLGANLGNAPARLKWALDEIGRLPSTQLVSQSMLYRSAPVEADGPDYFNAVAHIRTTLQPLKLLSCLQGIENEAGRNRPYRNAPRTLDLDILLYGRCQIESETLTVPHPRITQRAFVLLPLHEIAPELITDAQLQAVSHQPIHQIGAVK